MNTAEKVADLYVILQHEIFGMLIDAIKGVRPRLTDLKAEEMVEWRLKALAQMGALTQQVVDYVKNQSPAIAKAIDSVIKRDGLKVSQSFNKDLAKVLNQTPKPVSTETVQLLESYAAQTWKSLDNNVNQSLLSTNAGKNPALRVYQDIINKSTLAVTTGLKTPQKAIFDSIDDWVKSGLPTTLIDKGGHKWSLEGYARTVITTTTLRTYNDVRMQSLKDYSQTLAIMTSHPAARPACAPIQGKVVNVVDHGDPRFNPKYPTIYDYGYGTPAGTLGINCMHQLYPFVEGVTENHQEHYDPKKAIENGQTQQMQRYYERQVRKWKQRKEAAERLGNVDMVAKCNSAIRGYQSKVRAIVKDNDFLTRQYDREKIVPKSILGRASGALNNQNDPTGKRRAAYRDSYYDFLSNIDESHLIARMSKNSGIDVETVSRVYKHVFKTKYSLFDQETYKRKMQYFAPDYDMARSFERIFQGKPEEHDIIMLKHEALEARYMDEMGMYYEFAHRLTDRHYNYYAALKKWKEENHIDDSLRPGI